MTLDAEYITAAEHRARRFSGAYTGTSGTLAADVMRLLKERATMTAAFDQLESDNQALREAVEARLNGGVVAAEAACCEDEQCDEQDDQAAEIPSDWILRGERELKETPETIDIRQLGGGLTATGDETPAERLLLDALDAVRDRRKKYGPPTEHFRRTIGMINALFGHKLREPFTIADWGQIMILDKLARNQEKSVGDNQVDCAGYAACWAECEAP